MILSNDMRIKKLNFKKRFDLIIKIIIFIIH